MSKPEGKIFMSGRSQAVRIPKEFRLPGTTVTITRVGRGLLLEPVAPVEPARRTTADIEAMFARIDALGPLGFTEADVEEPPMPPDNPDEMFD